MIVLLAIIFVLAVTLVAGLVLFLLWWKRRKLCDQQAIKDGQAGMAVLHKCLIKAAMLESC